MKKRCLRPGLAALLLAVVLALSACGGAGSVSPADSAGAAATPTPEPVVAFPCALEDGALVVQSLFQASVSNPDCGDRMGENTAAMELKNSSGRFLARADVTAVLADGTVLRFAAQDIPADGVVWAFETSNTTLPDGAVCRELTCTASYEDEAPLLAEQVSVTADGTSVTVQNLTDRDLAGLQIGFHCLFDGDVYYGGIVYTYPVESLPAGGSASLEVPECFLGAAQAVRVTQAAE